MLLLLGEGGGGAQAARGRSGEAGAQDRGAGGESMRRVPKGWEGPLVPPAAIF